MMTDSHAWMHGKKFALYGDADFALGMTKMLLEFGAEVTDVLVNHANKRWRKACEEVLAASPYGQNATVHIGKGSLAFPFIGFH